jgi:hypothetical protein
LESCLSKLYGILTVRDTMNLNETLIVAGH